MRRQLALWIPLCTVCLAVPLQARAHGVSGDGLKAAADASETWAPWQARWAFSAPAPLATSWSSATLASSPALLAGDRYLGWGRLGSSGGLRATGALLVGASALSLASPAGATPGEMLWRPTAGATDAEGGAMPYLGMGYSAWWARTGLGVSADLGVAATRPNEAVRFGRVMSGSEGLDDMFRAMQLSPVLQVNLSYAF
ncbi:hypothetical protein [Ideonella sp.]|uniref:hypothetical protein n=1 Tax=Ideonella sp. TaxID=1929293 RepID=UPI0035B0AC5E